MHQPFDTFFKLDENAKVGNVGYFSFNDGAGRIIVHSCLPGIRLKLLDTKREPFVFPVDF